MKKRAATLLGLGFLVSGFLVSACGGSSETSGSTPSSSSLAAFTKNVALPTTTLVKVFTPTTLGGAPCAPTGPCKVGQTGPAGGLVFLAASAPQAWGQYMEVKPELFGTMVADWCPKVPFLGGAIGDGMKQIVNAVKGCTAANKPEQNAKLSAFILAAYAQNGFDDWFIPSKAELVELANSKVISIPTNKDISSYSYYDDPSFLGYAATWGFRGDAMQRVGYAPNYNMSVLADGGATYGDLKIRNGEYYIARAFGPKTAPPTTVAATTTIKKPTTTTVAPKRR